jgi:hypothetical protein
MKTKLTYLAIAIAAAVPALLQAQSAGAQSNTAAQAQAATPQARINSSLETALAAGIPVELLESKVAEGRAKGVSEARIAAAVEARLQGLTRAAAAMERAEVENTTAADLSVAADAFEAGVSESTLIKVSRTAPAERRAVAIATLTGLVQLGHASEHALARVSAVVRSNAGLANLHAEVASQLGVGAGGANVGGNAGGIVRIK